MVIIHCTGCSKKKNPEDFPLRPDGTRGKQCIICRERAREFWKTNKYGYKEKRKKYYRENKERHQKRNFKNYLLKAYKLSLQEYDEMMLRQNGCCAICKREFSKKKSLFSIEGGPCVDHCHTTNKVRGLLCRKCNLSLSYVETGFINKAIEYLRVHEVKDKELSR